MQSVFDYCIVGMPTGVTHQNTSLRTGAIEVRPLMIDEHTKTAILSFNYRWILPLRFWLVEG